MKPTKPEDLKEYRETLITDAARTLGGGFEAFAAIHEQMLARKEATVERVSWLAAVCDDIERMRF